jgi:hypothetical protein
LPLIPAIKWRSSELDVRKKERQVGLFLTKNLIFKDSLDAKRSLLPDLQRQGAILKEGLAMNGADDDEVEMEEGTVVESDEDRNMDEDGEEGSEMIDEEDDDDDDDDDEEEEDDADGDDDEEDEDDMGECPSLIVHFIFVS